MESLGIFYEGGHSPPPPNYYTRLEGACITERERIAFASCHHIKPLEEQSGPSES